MGRRFTIPSAPQRRARYGALGYATPAAHAAGIRLAASRPVVTVADDGDNTCRSLVAAE